MVTLPLLSVVYTLVCPSGSVTDVVAPFADEDGV